jgi:phosphoribosylaminoimidazolecarboxamide formyltransferase/IMP cyclohydrolase
MIYLKALSCDPISVFGGVVAFDRFIEENVACEISKLFVECYHSAGIFQERVRYSREKKILEY